MNIFKTKKIRNWHAVAAWNRNSAGPIPDNKKDANKNACRDFEINDFQDLYYICGFMKDNSKETIEEILVNPTYEERVKLAGKSVEECKRIQPAKIKEILNIDVDENLDWFFITVFYQPTI